MIHHYRQEDANPFTPIITFITPEKKTQIQEEPMEDEYPEEIIHPKVVRGGYLPGQRLLMKHKKKKSKKKKIDVEQLAGSLSRVLSGF
jgi:hypothetical protein